MDGRSAHTNYYRDSICHRDPLPTHDVSQRRHFFSLRSDSINEGCSYGRSVSYAP